MAAFSLQMEPAVAVDYRSGCQIARRVTEAWGSKNLYCLACDRDRLKSTPNNSQAVDFECDGCNSTYQLKASKKWSEGRVPDAGYDAMVRAMQSDRVPNLLVMQYTSDWEVSNLLLVPSFFFSLAAIEKRPPLAPTARRAGWVGCNILLDKIAPEGKIRIVTNSQVIPKIAVRASYERARPLSRLRANIRGWALDVLRIVRAMNTEEFTLSEVYRKEGELSSLYPGNRNIRPKIRQQLQVLRDLGFVEFLGQGRYRIR